MDTGQADEKKDIDMLTEAGIIIEEPAFLWSYTGYQNLDFLYRLRHPPKSGKAGL